MHEAIMHWATVHEAVMHAVGALLQILPALLFHKHISKHAKVRPGTECQ